MIPICHKGRFISIQFNYNDYVLYFRNSCLLLFSSLRKLGDSFKFNNLKGYFPQLFVNKNDKKLNSLGKVPDTE